jgi:nitrogen-specific signal transduction histidine kinase
MSEFDDRFRRILEQAIYGDFILGIIHNLSTPLSGILGGAQLLEMRLKNWIALIENLPIQDEEAIEKILTDHRKNIGNIELIIRNARSLSELISNMVQTQNKSVMEEIEVTSIHEFLKHVFKFLEGNMVFKHQVKKIDNLPEILPPVRMVYNHTAQLIFEWIRRCLPALDKHASPKLVSSAQVEGGQVVLTLTLNVPFDESPPLDNFPQELIPLAGGIRLPLSYYTHRLEQDGHTVDVITEDSGTTLEITFGK